MVGASMTTRNKEDKDWFACLTAVRAALCQAIHEKQQRDKHVENIWVSYSDAGSSPASSTLTKCKSVQNALKLMILRETSVSLFLF